MQARSTTATDPEPLATVRRILLFLVLLGTCGLTVELLLLEHTESATQLIPFAVLGAGLAAAVWQMLGSSRRSLRALQAIMILYVAVGLLGVVLHLKGNIGFERETNPSVRGLALLWHSLTGGVPLLAPAAMAQLGLMGLVFAYRHPVLRTGAASIQSQETS